jgi:uncharacterized membrane protein
MAWIGACLIAASLLTGLTGPASAQHSPTAWPQLQTPDPRVPEAPDAPPATGLRASGDQADLPLWERTLYKTLTYQAVANATDLILFELFLINGATAATTAGFFAVNAATAAAAYYSYEYAWRTYGPPLDETDERTLAEKSILYRGIASSRNFILGYAFSGSLASAAAFVAANFATDSVIFLSNEYVWDILRPDLAP